jgi:hypothetical protein
MLMVKTTKNVSLLRWIVKQGDGETGSALKRMAAFAAVLESLNGANRIIETF